MRKREKQKPAALAGADGLGSKGALAGADLSDVAWPTPAIKREMQDDFAEAVAEIVGTFDDYTKADALDLAASALGVNGAKWLFIANPIGLAADSEDRSRCIEFFASTIVGNPVFASVAEANHAAAVALETFGVAYDEMVAFYASAGGHA